MGKYTTTIRHTSKPLRVLLRLAATASPSTHRHSQPQPTRHWWSPVPPHEAALALLLVRLGAHLRSPAASPWPSASPSTHHGNVRPKPDLPRASPVPRQHLPQRPGARLTRRLWHGPGRLGVSVSRVVTSKSRSHSRRGTSKERDADHAIGGLRFRVSIRVAGSRTVYQSMSISHLNGGS